MKINMEYILYAGNGRTFKVDSEDFARVKQFNWTISVHRGKLYVVRCLHPENKIQYLHHFVLNTNSRIDHIDGDGLNCAKANLRCATVSQNAASRSHLNTNNTTGFHGVWIDKRAKKKKFVAEIKYLNKKQFIGSFYSAEEAAKAYDERAKKLFGEFATLNFKSNL